MHGLSDPDKYRYPFHPIPSYTSASISYWGDVRPNGSSYMGSYLLLSVYCNSLLATLNIRKTIRSRGNSIPGIPLSPIEENYNQPRPVGPRLPDKTEQKKSWVTRPTSSDCPSAGQHLSPVSESLEMGRGLDLEGQNEGDLKSSSL